MNELHRAGVDFVLMRHEANAGIAAAVRKLRRQPGVVLATLGPGAVNLMLLLSNAYLDREPLLAISAQIPDDFPERRTLREVGATRGWRLQTWQPAEAVGSLPAAEVAFRFFCPSSPGPSTCPCAEPSTEAQP